MKPYIERITKITILPEGEPIFSEMATHIEVEDEAAGEYLIVSQDGGHVDSKPNSISISPDEWPKIKAAIDKMMKSLREDVL